MSPKQRSRLPTDLGEALANQEVPRMKWKALLQIAAAAAVLWVTSFIMVPFIGYWGVGVVGVLTLVAIGFGIYVYRMTSRSRAILDIMKGATDEAGRQRALEALSDNGKDAMKALARAQLLAQTDPMEAQRTLEAVDLQKAPAVLQDDVRAQLAMIYLRNHRTREARALVDPIRLDRRPDPKTKALYAAIMAEAFARTGSPEEARKLLETYSSADNEHDEVRVMLLRSQAFTYTALKKRGLATRAMQELCAIEPNLLGGFLLKGGPPEVAKLARQVLAESGAGPKVKIKQTHVSQNAPGSWNVQRMLAWITQDLQALGIASPRLDAELLLGHALGCERVRLYLDMQRPLDPEELAAVKALVVRRRRREPVAYILGEREFYQRKFEITSAVLVPRPETEVLVDRALEALPEGAERALDLCTGSGVIAISLALEREGLAVDATDLSEAALAVAARNAQRLGAEARVQFHHGDLFADLPAQPRYALIAANPPYVRDDEYAALAPEITQHEPKLALVAGADGLDVIRRICSGAADRLLPGAALLLELGQGQAKSVLDLLARDPRMTELKAHRDLAGIERVVEARRRVD